MPDLHEVVDLGAIADEGVIDAAAVDRRVRTNVDVVADDRPPDLRELGVGAIAKHVTKTIASDAHTAVNLAALAEGRAWIERHVREEARVYTDVHAVAHGAMRADPRAIAYHDALADQREGLHPHVRPEPRRRRDNG